MKITKTPNLYLDVKPWTIEETGYHSENHKVSESVFSLANEYMGVRGYFEEGSASDSLKGSYFNGIYEKRETQKSAYKGITAKAHYMVNSVDWLKTEIYIDDKRVIFDENFIYDFKTILDMKSGILTRSYKIKISDKKQLSLAFKRFLSMDTPYYAYQVIDIKPLDFNGKVDVKLLLSCDNLHGGKPIDWNVIHKGVSNEKILMVSRTKTTNQHIYSAFDFSCSSDYEKEKIDLEKETGILISANLIENETFSITKNVTNVAYKNSNTEIDEIIINGDKIFDSHPDIKTSEEKNKKFWNDVFEKTDIEIHGDDLNSQGIRYCLFQLTQTYHGFNADNNIGAKGLTGEAYSGHTFWDTETYCLPFYLLNNINAAKNLLEYRYKTLPNAIGRAKELDCIGACYPIATLNGDEACDLWQHANTQFHPSTSVAYGIWHYVNLSGDKEFLHTHGVEMLTEISRFLCSRGQYSSLTGGFGFYGVMGPDEFQLMVNNNCYTNYMAKKTFLYTLEVINELSSWDRDNLNEKVSLTEDELSKWAECAEKMIIPYEKETKIFEQHQGFFDLPHIDINEIPKDEFPLYHNWSYDRIYRNDMIKQPDVLMMMFLYPNDFTLDELKANYEYYEPRTVHESSLSPSVHSILASALGKNDEACELFSFAARMDLDNYNRNTAEGLHTTSIAAAWVNIIYGFGGVRTDRDILAMSPTLPISWESYSFKLTYRGVFIKVSVCKENITIKADKDIEIYLKYSDLDGKISIDGNKEWSYRGK